MRAPYPGYARFAWATLIFTLFVILWGAFVRATGSGAGCGSHWPLCNGEIVPHSPAYATVIEFGHRITSGLSLFMVVGMWWGARSRFDAGDPTRRAAAWSLFFMVTEALIGAGLVLFEYVADDARTARGLWVAGHLLNTFLLVGVMTACAAWASGAAWLSLEGRGRSTALLLAALVGMLVLGVSGAVTALGDTLFPAASFEAGKAATFSETAHLFVRLRIWHPTLAVLVGALVLAAAWVSVASRPEPAVRLAAKCVVGAYVAELLVGLANVWWLAPVWIQLVHLLLSDVIWISLVLLSLAVLAKEPGDGAPAAFAAPVGVA
ncbi:MAG: COX15/CtaA family protein [Candidatus Binatia bacterium]|nr:COX15/CtaA family protein [Candidatus Binatia bacterium]